MVIAVDSPQSAFAQASTEEIWLGPGQQAGLTHLCAETPVRVLIGPQSSGKSTLLGHFRHHLSEVIALDLTGPQTDAGGVLAELLDATMLNADGLSEREQRNLLAVFFKERRSLGTRIILCVDEFSRIAAPAWEEILGLSALETSGKPLVELAVVGSPEEAAKGPLRDLVLGGRTSAVEAVRYLDPPADEDVERYIAWQLQRIGSRIRFSDRACRRISELGQGRFAEVNRLCTAILSAPHAESAVDADDVDATVKDLRRLESATVPPTIARRAPPSVAPPDTPPADRAGTQTADRTGTRAAETIRAEAVAAPAPKAAVPAKPAAASQPQGAPNQQPGPARIRRIGPPSKSRAAPPPPDRIVVERDGTIEGIVPLSGRLVIGRNDDSDLKLDGPKVSRNHAMIIPTTRGGLTLVDLNSVHGVFVNGERVRRHHLKTGDIVELCGYRLSLVRAGVAPKPAPTLH